MIDGVAVLVHHHDVAAGQDRLGLDRAEIEDRPVLRVGRPPSYFREARPGEADLEQRILEVQHGEPRGAEIAILLLRMLQDEQRHGVVDPGNALTYTERL